MTAGAHRSLRVRAALAWTCSGLVESGLVRAALLELSRAGEAERRVAPAGIVEPIDITGQSVDGLRPHLEDSAPDQLALQRLEERLNHGVVVTVALARHGDHNAISS